MDPRACEIAIGKEWNFPYAVAVDSAGQRTIARGLYGNRLSSFGRSSTIPDTRAPPRSHLTP
jgi:hypothetical protein